jgi:hypothetical protein
MNLNIKNNQFDEEIAQKGIEKLFNDFQIFNEDFNTSHIGFLLLSFILNLKPEKWNELKISYEKFCEALELVKSNEYIKEMFKAKE